MLKFSIRKVLPLILSVLLLVTCVGCAGEGSVSSNTPSDDSSTNKTSGTDNTTTNSETGGGGSDTTTNNTNDNTTTNTKDTTSNSKTQNNTTTNKTNANSKGTVTFSAKLDKAVTAKATFTGDSATPNFTDAQKSIQKEIGRELIKDIQRAAEDPSISTYVIPAGNYGFNLTNVVNGVVSGAVIRDVQRSADNPFTIQAEGVTFWFELTGKACADTARGLHFLNCSNIYLKGLTLDSYTANSIEGKITQIDKSGNRIGFKLYEGTMKLDANTISRAVRGSEFRMVAVKSTGELMASLYNINNGWGPESLWGKNLEVDSDGTVWFTLKTSTLMNTIFTNEWKNFYGKNGTLEVGDQIAILYGVVMVVTLDNCAQMRMEQLHCYLSKGTWWENGGYGDHLWKNCYFGPRPGTNRLLGTEGQLAQGLRHGSTYDGLQMNLTSDDALNIHGFWSTPTSYSADGKLKVSNAPVGIKAGDPVEFYASNGKLVATCTVAEDPVATYNYNGFLTSSIKLKEKPPANYTQMLIRWPNSECDGFVIRNCVFKDNYQRLLINSGSGVVENNIFLNNGSNLALTSNNAAYEGGVMGDIIIRNNVFYNSTNHPGASTVVMNQTTNWARYVSAENVTFTNNVFVNCGKMLTAANFKNLTVTNNVIVNPLLYGQKVSSFSDLVTISSSCSTKDYSGNTAYVIGGPVVDGTNAIKSTTDAKVESAGEICRNTKLSVSEVISQIKKLFK